MKADEPKKMLPCSEQSSKTLSTELAKVAEMKWLDHTLLTKAKSTKHEAAGLKLYANTPCTKKDMALCGKNIPNQISRIVMASKIKTVEECVDGSSIENDSEDEEERYEIIPDILDALPVSWRIKLDKKTPLPYGVKVTDVSSNVCIQVIQGSLQLVDLEIHLNTKGMDNTYSIFVQVKGGKHLYEIRHNVMNSKTIQFPEKLYFQENDEIHIQLMAENIQLYRCPLAVEITSKSRIGEKLDFEVTGNQRLVEDKIPCIIKRVQCRHWNQ